MKSSLNIVGSHSVKKVKTATLALSLFLTGHLSYGMTEFKKTLQYGGSEKTSFAIAEIRTESADQCLQLLDSSDPKIISASYLLSNEDPVSQRFVRLNRNAVQNEVVHETSATPGRFARLIPNVNYRLIFEVDARLASLRQKDAPSTAALFNHAYHNDGTQALAKEVENWQSIDPFSPGQALLIQGSWEIIPCGDVHPELKLPED